MKVSKRFIRHAATGTLISALTAPHVFAADVDYSTITAGFDPATAIVGALALCALLAGLYGAIKGGKILLGLLRG